MRFWNILDLINSVLHFESVHNINYICKTNTNTPPFGLLHWQSEYISPANNGIARETTPCRFDISMSTNLFAINTKARCHGVIEIRRWRAKRNEKKTNQNLIKLIQFARRSGIKMLLFVYEQHAVVLRATIISHVIHKVYLLFDTFSCIFLPLSFSATAHANQIGVYFGLRTRNPYTIHVTQRHRDLANA